MVSIIKSKPVGLQSDFCKYCLIIVSLVLISIHIRAQSGVWKLIDSLPTPRSTMMNACAVDSKIYFIGGTSANFSDLAANEVYDPLTGTWEIRKSMPTPRGFLATAVVNDTIYAIGGGWPTSPKRTVEAYDPVTDTWITKANMPISKSEIQAIVVNGKIYIMRGAFDTRNGLVYDPNTNHWDEIKELPELLRVSSLAVFNNLIYVFGGALGPTGPVFSTVNVYNPQTDSWGDKKKDMPTPRFAFQTLVCKGKIYAMGGTQGGTPGNGMSLPTLEVYDPVTDTWESKPDMPFSGAYLSGVVVNDKIYVTQGTPDWASGGVQLWEYDPSATDVYDSLSWLQIGTEVEYAIADNALGEDVFIGIGGWTCTQELVKSWVAALYKAKLYDLGVHHLYSVSGPKDEGYQSREIGTLDLARHLLSLIKSYSAVNRIIIAAHSSGAYVAHVLFQNLYDEAGIDSSHNTKGKILYFVLDEPLGSYPAVELTNTSADHLGHIYGVYAVISSQNLYSYAPSQMIALGNKYDSRSSTVVIDASSSNCSATMCLHMTMINQKPYQPNWYDARDYGAINTEHPVQTAYLDVITALDDNSWQPMAARLWQNYPNPFNPTTTISYQIPSTNYITLKIYDVLGSEIATLVNEEKHPGTYEVTWNAEGLSSGVYFYQLKAGNFVVTKKLLLLK